MSNFEFNFSAQEFETNIEPVVSFEVRLSSYSKAIHEKALGRAKRYLVAEADLLESIIEIDRDRIYEKFGEAYLTPYCVKYLKLSEEVAAMFVRVARKSQQVPELNQAVQDGKITMTKAKTIAAVITDLNKDEWIDKANTLTKEKLEKEVAKESPNPRKNEKAKAQGPNRTRLEFELSDEDLEMQRRAQDIFCQKKGHSPSLAEMQRELLLCYLKKHDPVQKAKRSEMKRKNQNAKKADTTTAIPDHISPGPECSQEHPQRTPIPAALKNQVYQRDQGKCQAHLPDGSICGHSRWVHLHHIQEISKGGAHTLENLITLCSAHHRIWHRRE